MSFFLSSLPRWSCPFSFPFLSHILPLPCTTPGTLLILKSVNEFGQVGQEESISTAEKQITEQQKEEEKEPVTAAVMGTRSKGQNAKELNTTGGEKLELEDVDPTKVTGAFKKGNVIKRR